MGHFVNLVNLNSYEFTEIVVGQLGTVDRSRWVLVQNWVTRAFSSHISAVLKAAHTTVDTDINKYKSMRMERVQCVHPAAATFGIDTFGPVRPFLVSPYERGSWFL